MTRAPTGDRGASLSETCIPFMPRGVRLRRCPLRNASFLLAPERAVKLQGPAAAILGALDGERTLGGLVDHLAETFSAPRDQIDRDVRAFLDDMAARRMVEFRL